MTSASYIHHMGHVAVVNDTRSILDAQYDAALWHGNARYNLDILGGRYADNAPSCQEYSARVYRAVRVAMGNEK